MEANLAWKLLPRSMRLSWAMYTEKKNLEIDLPVAIRDATKYKKIVK